eukprot:361935-Chlamydomonas_euryale.AAC.4
MKSASRGVPGSSQKLCLPTLAFKARDLCQLLADAIALPDPRLVAAAVAAPDGHLRRDIGNALDALAHGWVDCLDAFRPARPARF